MSRSDGERVGESRSSTADEVITSIVKIAPGVVVGAGVVLIFNKDAASQFAVGLAVLVIALVARYARRKRGAPIQTFLANAGLGLALIATLTAAFGPKNWQSYAILSVGLLTALAVVSRDATWDRVATLRAVSLTGLGVTLIWLGLTLLPDNEGRDRLAALTVVVLGIALILLGLADVTGRARLRGLSFLGIGLPLTGVGAGVMVDGESLAGVSLCLAGGATASLGVAQLTRSERLRGSTFIVFGVGLLGLALDAALTEDATFTPATAGAATAFGALGVAALGRGVDSLVGGSGVAEGAMVIGGVLAGVGGGVAAAGGVNLLLTAVLVGFGVEACWSGAVKLSDADLAVRVRAWWVRFTTGSDS